MGADHVQRFRHTPTMGLAAGTFKPAADTRRMR